MRRGNGNHMNATRTTRTAALSLLGRLTPFTAALLLTSAAQAQSTYSTPYTFNTLAGAPYVPGIVDATGAAAQFLSPSGVAVDASGNLYVADEEGNVILKITPGGAVTTLAGTSLVSGHADGTGTAATFHGPTGIAIDGQGNVYVADSNNYTIRKITPAGVVSTFAGTAGVSGSNDATGSAAQFSLPIGLTIDGSGNLYVVDGLGNSIRKITTPGAVVTTFAGGNLGSTDGTGTAARFKSPAGITIDGSGNLYVSDQGNNTIRKITTSGAVVTTLAGTAGARGTADGTGGAAQFYLPAGLAVDTSGNVYVSDSGNYTIRKITSGGSVTTFAGVAGLAGFVDGTGTAALFDFYTQGVGGTALPGLAGDSNGNIYVSDNNNSTIRKIVTSTSAVATLAGTPGEGNSDGSGSSAHFNLPAGMAVDGSGNVYVADLDNYTIRKITPGGAVTTFAGTPGAGGSADGTGAAARFYLPYAVAVDGSGNVYVADTGNNTIRKITPAGVVSTLAGAPPTTYPASGNYHDGTGSAALFNEPLGIAVDSSGNVYVSENQNFDIRMITPSGVTTTLAGTAGTIGSKDGTGPAAQFNQPAGIAVDSKGNLYVADRANSTIRKIVISTAAVSTIAGKAGIEGNADGTGPAAQFYAPIGVAVDSNQNVYVTDSGNNTIRMVAAGTNAVTTLAGTPPAAYTQPPARGGYANGTGAAALFYSPYYLAVDGSANLFVSDTGNDVIRQGTPSAAPYIVTQPSDQYVAVGGSATFSVTASGTSLTYQWDFNATPIGGATGSSYTVTNAQSSNAGPYTVVVTDSNGSTTSNAATLHVNTGTSGARLVNISTRAMVGTGANIMIPGFVIQGSGTETLLIRGDGPSLTALGVAGALAQPVLTVLSGQTVIASNTAWGTSTNPAPAQIASVAAQVGAFPFASGSADCAVIVNLPAGAYTVEISGVNNTTGVALAEVYEVATTGTRLVNIATRAQVGTGGNIMIAGFVVSGNGPEELLVRGDGPSLTALGVAGALAQPVLNVLSGQTSIASNTGWGTSTNPTPAQIASIAAGVGAFPFASGSADSAVVVTITAGAYTAQISGVNNTTGVSLAEVYEVP
jgi:sugar lactone lactonase YvrE